VIKGWYLEKTLIALVILNILGGILGFIVFLGTNIIYSLISLIGGIIGSVPYFTLVGALEDIEVLYDEQRKLKGQLHKTIDSTNDYIQSYSNTPPYPKEFS
jgi:hypothetical protein